MPATARWIRKKQEQKARIKEQQVRRKIEAESKVSKFPTASIYLNSQIKVVQEVDLKDESNSFLLVEDFNKNTVSDEGVHFNKETIEKLEWVEFDDFRLTVIPISDILRAHSIAVRFIVECLNPELDGKTLKIYADWNKEGLQPRISNESVSFVLHHNRFSSINTFIGDNLESQTGLKRDMHHYPLLSEKLVDIAKHRIDTKESPIGSQTPDENFFIFVVGEEISMHSIIVRHVRVKVFYDYIPFQKVEDYNQLKESGFFNLVESKHVHPKTVKQITNALVIQNEQFSEIEANSKIKKNIWLSVLMLLGLAGSLGLSIWLGLTYWILFAVVLVMALAVWSLSLARIATASVERKYIQLAKDLNLIEDNQERIEVRNIFDEKWIKDFCEISTYWHYIPEMNKEVEENLANITLI